MPSCYLSIGSNLGDRRANCRNAIERLRAIEDVRVVAQSALYETEPIGFTGQPDFLNLALGIETDRKASDLLAHAKEIEIGMGRKRTVRFGPRAIDIDLLLFGDLVLDEPEMIIPHPRLHERRFVLTPLADIAPLVVHPVLGKTIAELLATLDDGGKGVRRVE